MPESKVEYYSAIMTEVAVQLENIAEVTDSLNEIYGEMLKLVKFLGYMEEIPDKTLPVTVVLANGLEQVGLGLLGSGDGYREPLQLNFEARLAQLQGKLAILRAVEINCTGGPPAEDPPPSPPSRRTVTEMPNGVE